MRLAWMLVVGLGFVCGTEGAVQGVTNTAQARLFSLSIRVLPATAGAGGAEYAQEFTSAHFGPPNGEWYPVFEDEFTHATVFRLKGPAFPDAVLGEMAVRAPEELDANTNGIPDFYEVRMEVPGTTTKGAWGSDVAGGEVRTVWQRAAGEVSGTVTLQFESREFGNLPEFRHRFQIREYEGTLRYTPGDPFSAQGFFNALGVDGGQLAGPWLFGRQPTNRLHQLEIGESNLTNEVGRVVRVSLGDIEADPDYTMDYFGAVAFMDGDPSSPEVDFEIYYMGVDDPNDVDGDGVPDFTDDTFAPPPPPELRVVRDGDGLRLRMRGEPGVTYSLMRTLELDPEGWRLERKITFDRAEAEVSVSLGLGRQGFWQLRWP